MSCLALYEPINTLKRVAHDVWIVDGPEIGMSLPFLTAVSMPFTTRMTVVRLPDGGLWVHSPTPLTDTLATEIADLGPVRALVAPNRIHYRWIGEWKQRFPAAAAYAAPDMGERAQQRTGGFDVTLGEAPPTAWEGTLEQWPVAGDYMTEMVFFHRASRTLVLTDLIENFEPDHIHCKLVRWMCRLGGVCDPDGKMPRDMRWTFRHRRTALRDAVQRMKDWGPDRIILAHGRWYPQDGRAELDRAFRWLM